MKDAGRRGLLWAWPFSVAVHLMILAALFWSHAGSLSPQTRSLPILVNIVEVSAPEPPGTPAEEVNADSLQDDLQPESQPVTAPEPVIAPAAPPTQDTSDLLSESQLVGAVSVDGQGAGGGDGGEGGSCNTALVLQRALEGDPLVRKAVADARRLGKAVLLWNGDWVRSGHQDGKGLSGVREAIMWELAFAPEACRNRRVNGLVLLSMADGTRFAIGSDDWRWSDLLGLRQAGPRREAGATPHRRQDIQR